MSKHSKVSKGRYTITSTPSSFSLLLPSLYLPFPFLIFLFLSPFTTHSIPSIYFLLFTTTSSSSSSPLLHTTVTCSDALLCYTAPLFTYIPSPFPLLPSSFSLSLLHFPSPSLRRWRRGVVSVLRPHSHLPRPRHF